MSSLFEVPTCVDVVLAAGCRVDTILVSSTPTPTTISRRFSRQPNYIHISALALDALRFPLVLF